MPALAEPDFTPPCEWGPTGHCQNGDHHNCQCSTGGSAENGQWHPSGYVTDPRGQCVMIKGRAVPFGPWHLWRCPCRCHTDASPAVFNPSSKWQR
jgi:hypothetical protein